MIEGREVNRMMVNKELMRCMVLSDDDKDDNGRVYLMFILGIIMKDNEMYDNK
jgi:hypothetical protein